MGSGRCVSGAGCGRSDVQSGFDPLQTVPGQGRVAAGPVGRWELGDREPALVAEPGVGPRRLTEETSRRVALLSRSGAVPASGSPRQETETPPAAAPVHPPALFSTLSAEELTACHPSIASTGI